MIAHALVQVRALVQAGGSMVSGLSSVVLRPWNSLAGKWARAALYHLYARS